MTTRVLVTENDPFLGQLYLELLGKLPDVQIDLAVSPKSFRELLGKTRYSLFLFDIDLGDPEENGIDLLRSLRGCTGAPIIMVSGRVDGETIEECLRLGASFIPKSRFLKDVVYGVRHFAQGLGWPEGPP